MNFDFQAFTNVFLNHKIQGEEVFIHFLSLRSIWKHHGDETDGNLFESLSVAAVITAQHA